MIKQIAHAFRELVELRYRIYNGLIMTLPLEGVIQTSAWLPLLKEACEEGLAENRSPDTILRQFFDQRMSQSSEEQQIDFLFKVIQFVERQVVLIDSLEDAAYNQIHRVTGPNSWRQLADRADSEGNWKPLREALEQTSVRVVLTAHPTQFYPKTVLDIINDLVTAIRGGDNGDIQMLLEQLGKTRFIRREKPSPYDEAKLLNNYLVDVFYRAVGNLLDDIETDAGEALQPDHELIQLGFWPGGDRDGNPFVTVEITKQVAAMLKASILSCYEEDLELLARRLSFEGVHERVLNLKDRIATEAERPWGDGRLDYTGFVQELEQIAEVLRREHKGLYLDRLKSFSRKVRCFGFHFASLDLRQDSRVLGRTFEAIAGAQPELIPGDLSDLGEREQIEALLKLTGEADPAKIEDDQLRDTAESVAVIRSIQRANGEAGAHRYIISNCRSAVDIARLYALFRLSGWGSGPLTVDFVPLFETVSDLKGAADSMRTLYDSPTYREHLARRGHRQTVMVGFSDGTKDGGYLMANWAIYRAKEEVTRVSREAGVEVVFFDGRGGPPARGGGNSHLFYSALGKSIENRQIELTIQGQTISSQYGIIEAAMHNLELLLTGGLKGKLFVEPESDLEEAQRKLIDRMAEISYKAYEDLKNHPLFIPYLLERSTLRYYGMTNIGSRPTSRGSSEEFRFEDLRAIPFVGAWSQFKQNVPGYYGLGTALKTMERNGEFDKVRRLFADSKLFQAYIANSMQSMSKVNFGITRHMKDDEKFGEFWQMLHDEFQLSREMVLKVSGQEELLADNPRSRRSIQLREQVVLPLLTIQQYALIRVQQLREENEDDERIDSYEKMVMRSLFGSINAARNAV